MSLTESGHSTGEVSLRALLEGEAPRGNAEHLDFREVVRRIVIGGWPDLIGADEGAARQWVADYLTQIAEVDVQGLGGRRDPRNIRRLLAALGRSVGQATKSTELARDVGGDDGPIASQTLASYINALGRLHLVEDSEAWRPHMRSRVRLRQAAVRYLVDPSLGLSALNAGSADLLTDLSALGLHFEALVIRDLRIYAQPLRGTIESWRDANGHEVDAIVNVDGAKWGAFEVKLGHESIDEAAASLHRFATKVDTGRQGAPAFLGVIVSTGRSAYRRQDGIDVIPIGCLGP